MGGSRGGGGGGCGVGPGGGVYAGLLQQEASSLLQLLLTRLVTLHTGHSVNMGGLKQHSVNMGGLKQQVSFYCIFEHSRLGGNK